MEKLKISKKEMKRIMKIKPNIKGMIENLLSETYQYLAGQYIVCIINKGGIFRDFRAKKLMEDIEEIAKRIEEIKKE